MGEDIVVGTWNHRSVYDSEPLDPEDGDGNLLRDESKLPHLYPP